MFAEKLSKLKFLTFNHSWATQTFELRFVTSIKREIQAQKERKHI